VGIFDIFGTGDQQAAAASQIQGLEQGYNLGTGYTNQAIGSLNTGAGTANAALGTGYGNAATALNTGYGNASTALGQNYAASIAPYLQNYGQATQGTTQLGNVLGLNGAAGNASALQALQNTPGYQFQLQQGDNSVNAAAAANGTLNSGNQLLALSNYNQGLAGTTYNNYVSQLQPYLGAANAAAGGIASGYQGLGQGQAGLATGLAQGQAGLATGLAGGQAGIATGLGSATAAQQDQEAQMGWQLGTGTGNANANADLAGLNASGNFWGLLGGLGGMKTSGGGTVGGNALSSLGSMGSSALSSLGSLFGLSDVRAKEDIEKVGELFDGSNVYRFKYIGSPKTELGLMAQEVEQTRPDAVVEIGGLKHVDYGRATEYASELSKFLKAA
jgi:hypothetical protein